MNQEFELNSEPLWAMPAHVRERIGHYSQKSDYDNYCHRSVLTVARALVLDRAASRYHHDGAHVSVPVPFRWSGALDFDVNRYNSEFVARIIATTLIITVLTCIPEYFRLKAERDLLLSINDLEALTYCDLSTRLANRSFLEKILHTEFGRHQRLQRFADRK
jgi:hypothetical protein